MKKLEPYGHLDPKLVIWVADKLSDRGHALLAWNLMRLSLIKQAVQVRFESNWKDGGLLRTIGGVSLFMGKEVVKKTIAIKHFDSFLETRHDIYPAFFTHSVDYAIMNPANTYRINRTLFVAATFAKLSPIVQLDVPPFQHFNV